ncbi:alpha/beta fold hydrolase [Fibrella sp. HMF5335]|uniref:Alpha/beta fold hydrolase n=1 Tax=Fibrella rubiginis TaxID=2817060 RepID=A0A939GCB1_9BACT|nr:alpha/beta fold hydrolase [Fibrella rubiginis]MBO0935716.1 alpha/beta fold hydrolase [Fibrella rubiginis]
MATHWLDTAEYPFISNYANINGYNLHYIDEGEGETVLFVHGTPSWSFDFRNVIKKLAKHFRCVAIDHIGFGLSDKPERYDYSTQNHSETLEKFVFEKQLDNITLVVHDVGGPIGLNFAMKLPDRIKRLVILNSWLWSSRYEPDFIRLSKILKNPLLPFLYRYLNFSPKFILPNSFGDHKITNKLLKQYTGPFANKTQRNGALAFAKSLLNDQDWFESLWIRKQDISNKPTLFIWGLKDPVIKVHYLHKFVSGFTNSQVISLETSGHFPQEEQPEVVAKAIFNFLLDKEHIG